MNNKIMLFLAEHHDLLFVCPQKKSVNMITKIEWICKNSSCKFEGSYDNVTCPMCGKIRESKRYEYQDWKNETKTDKETRFRSRL